MINNIAIEEKKTKGASDIIIIGLFFTYIDGTPQYALVIENPIFSFLCVNSL